MLITVTVDGVINGNYRCSLAGCDLNRRFLDANEELHPTIVALKDLMFHLHQSRGISLYLDFHGHSAKKNTLIYGCDYVLEERKGTKGHVAAPQQEEMDARRLFSRLFPKILSRVSRDFSYRDCKYQVQLSKRGTGRVAAWKNVGVCGSYTVEVSFCGNGNNRETEILRHVEREAYLQETGKAGSGLATTMHWRGDGQRSLEEEIQRLREYYATGRHYSQLDLKRIGRDIGLSIFHFSNLEEMQHVDARHHATGSLFEKSNCYKDFGHLSDDLDDVAVPVLNAECLQKPILTPAVFSVNALTSSRTSIRAFCEMSVRRELRIGSFSAGTPGDTSMQVVLEGDEDEKEAEESEVMIADDKSEGSDSDPSGDEMPVKERMKTGMLKKLLKPESSLLRIYRIKKPVKQRRPSSAGSKRTTGVTRGKSFSGKFMRPIAGGVSSQAADTGGKPTVPLASDANKGESSLKRLTTRVYEKFNFSKATQNSLLRAAITMEPAYNEAGADGDGSNAEVQVQEQTSGTIPATSGKLTMTLKPRGIYFPSTV